MKLIPRAELLTLDLCDEIDDLRQQLKEAIAQRDYWANEYAKMQTRELEHGQRMIVGMLALAIKPVDEKLALSIAEKALKREDS